MASTVEFKTKEDGTIIYRTVASNGRGLDGKPIRKTWTFEARSLKAAKKKGDLLEAEWKAETKRNLPVSNPTFGELVEFWRTTYKYQKLAPKTKERYEDLLKNHILPVFGSKKVEEIRVIDVEQFLIYLRDPGRRKDKNNLAPYSEKTIQAYVMLLNVLLSSAVKWEMASRNVCDYVDKPTVKRKKAKFYDEDQIETLLKCLDEEGERVEQQIQAYDPNHRNHRKLSEQRKREIIAEKRYMYHMLRAYVYLALGTACRRSELCGLNWTDIDLSENYMIIDTTLQYSHISGKVESDFLKNGEDTKEMYIPETTIDELKKYQNEQKRYKEIMGEKWVESGKVFTCRYGDLVFAEGMSARFRRFLQRYELDYITLHQIRHTSISYLLMKGVPLAVVSERAGHSDPTVTAKIYGHVFKKNKKAIAPVAEMMFGSAKEEVEYIDF